MRFGPVGVSELFIVLTLLLLALLPLFLLWRVFSKAGLPPMTALLCLIPGVGLLLTLVVLAFTQWPIESARSSARGM